MKGIVLENSRLSSVGLAYSLTSACSLNGAGTAAGLRCPTMQFYPLENPYVFS